VQDHRKGTDPDLRVQDQRTGSDSNAPNIHQDLGDIQNQELRELLGEYRDIFRNELLEGLPPKRAVDHEINTGSEAPVNKNAYALSVQQLREQTKQVEDLLKRGVLRESVSPWGAPVLFVAKKVPGEWRMCIDYRALNAKSSRMLIRFPEYKNALIS
jgi:hypothetical protein